jgi:hypothetical protein
MVRDSSLPDAGRSRDLTAVLFDGVDKLQHLLWRFIDPAYVPAHPSVWEQNIREPA